MSSATDGPVIRVRVKNNQALKYTDECRKIGVHANICLKAGDESFSVHRLVLSCYSMYFRKMFQTEMGEKYADAVTIEGVDAISFKLIIDFIYTEQVCIYK